MQFDWSKSALDHKLIADICPPISIHCFFTGLINPPLHIFQLTLPFVKIFSSTLFQPPPTPSLFSLQEKQI